MTILAWHFVGETLRDGTPIPKDRVKLVHNGDVVMCESGLHASERIIDALEYAPGVVCCRVELSGKIVHDTNKSVASERTILWRIDVESVLREFARLCVLSVVYLWNMPPVVREYLDTGNEKIMNSARDASRAAAWAAACASWDAAFAARDASWDASRAAAFAARDAARDASWDAAFAARDAARDAARAAALEKQNLMLTEMVEAEHAKTLNT